MGTSYDPKDPTSVVVKQMAVDPSNTGTALGFKVVKVPITASSTLTGWINPEGNAILASPFVRFTTGGTGTFDLGTGTSGTGASAAFIDGGTMVAGVLKRPDAASSTVGATPFWLVVAGSGTVADSVTLTHNEATTSTAVGHLYIQYFVL